MRRDDVVAGTGNCEITKDPFLLLLLLLTNFRKYIWKEPYRVKILLACVKNKFAINHITVTVRVTRYH